ncbi:MAG: DUF3999 family protein [Thermoanaerobaculia bacterium]
MKARFATAVTLALLAQSPALAADATFAHERSIRPAASGANRLDVDVPLLSGARALRYESGVYRGGLDDLRLFDMSGREVPHLVIAPPPENRSWTSGKIIAIPKSRRASGFEADLGGIVEADRIRIAGLASPFLKRFRLEGSGDRQRWITLIESGTLFDLPEERLSRLDADFAAGAYRYLRVTWDDSSSSRLGLPSEVQARVSTQPPPAPPLFADAQFRRRESEPRRSRYRIRLSGRDLPVSAIHVVAGGGHVLRDARVTEARMSGDEVTPAVIGSATLRRAVRDGVPAEDLRIPIARPSGPDLELVIDDGDNPPLEIRAVRAEMMPLPSIYFEAPSEDELVARYGAPSLDAPRYDLEAMREFVMREDVATAVWGAARHAQASTAAVKAPGVSLTGAPVDRSDYAYARKVSGEAAGLSSLLLDAAALAHSRNLEDVRLVNDDDVQLPYLVERRGEPLALQLPLRLAEPAGADRVSRYEVRLPFENLPAGTLVLTTQARVFERSVVFSIPPDSKRNSERQQISSAVWQHADPETEAPPLTVSLDPRTTPVIEIAIDEGDNSPIPLSSAKLLLPQYGLRFFRPAGEVTLLYGNPGARKPRYDLGLLRAELFGLPAAEIRALAEDATPAKRAGKERVLFWTVVIIAVGALLFLIARMFRGESPAESTGHA